MIDMNEVLELQRKGDFAELTRRGIQISDGKLEQAEGWAKACFSGSRAHYFVQVSADAIGPGGRYRSWKSVCGTEAITHDKAPMFGAGSWERCKACLKKRNAKRSLEATQIDHMGSGGRQ
ncbi:hypothetical protein K5F93_20120 [Pseudomonas protegens]|uniref:hypothetical protein n=1 Tax=Pseudomonas protegens TaxID=380021 RepID=UPI001C8F078F|nr:hypothetical protein [Pseudomonas protegens]QZI68694.1 hypothetical protein K5F93_20120 [Pseudomonas protegens]